MYVEILPPSSISRSTSKDFVLWFFPARESCSSFFNYTPHEPRDPKKNKIGLGWYSGDTLSLRGQNERTQVSSRFVVICFSCGSIVSCGSPARSLEVEPIFNFPLRCLHRCLGEIHGSSAFHRRGLHRLVPSDLRRRACARCSRALLSRPIKRRRRRFCMPSGRPRSRGSSCGR